MRVRACACAFMHVRARGRVRVRALVCVCVHMHAKMQMCPCTLENVWMHLWFNSKAINVLVLLIIYDCFIDVHKTSCTNALHDSLHNSLHSWQLSATRRQNRLEINQLNILVSVQTPPSG